jgi:hypothetical protein
MYVVVNANGTLSEVSNVKIEDYGKRKCSWKLDNQVINLYGRTNQKQKGPVVQYDFPPPVDNTLFFKECLLVNPSASLNIDEWNSIYETLMGGFEDLCTESESEDDDDVERTKEGYAKDGFVVSDEENNEIQVKDC